MVEIPVNDQKAALEFCRRLSAMMKEYGPEEDPTRPSLPKMSKGDGVEVSVVIPVYNEEDNLPLIYDRLIKILEEASSSFEIIFVDDGSKDGSLDIMRGLAGKDGRVRCVELARNFGHQLAVTAGIDYAVGSAVIIMDADLQDPPEVLPDLIKRWRNGRDVVYAIREKRKEFFLIRAAFALFYRILQRVSSIYIPLDTGDFCLMDRRVADIMRGMKEENRFLRGMRSWVGLKQEGYTYERHARHAGETKYSIAYRVRFAIDGLISFSHLPLKFASYSGVASLLISLVFGAYYLTVHLTGGLSEPKAAILIVALFFVGGVQLLTLGIMGEYIARIFDNVKGRPLYVARRAGTVDDSED
ncbi:MAG: glycosyltransferase [Deltaproteobacteria bacterium]|uniref:Glycosyltransferase n=1 Tax=Candidatus Zymogenus saltonus TaxID=2844893 RepID=A0A9D8PMH2_9DELT|nr:glycosyltransferase [Candidatus Zymogenus saltonus]